MRYHATAPKEFLDKSETFVEPEEFQRLCTHYAPAGEYTVTTEKEQDHEWGHGGFREYRMRLLKGDQLLILSVDYISWNTTSDDSTDYAGAKIRRTYLLKEDPVACQIFDAIRARLPMPSKKEN